MHVKCMLRTRKTHRWGGGFEPHDDNLSNAPKIWTHCNFLAVLMDVECVAAAQGNTKKSSMNRGSRTQRHTGVFNLMGT